MTCPVVGETCSGVADSCPRLAGLEETCSGQGGVGSTGFCCMIRLDFLLTSSILWFDRIASTSKPRKHGSIIPLEPSDHRHIEGGSRAGSMSSVSLLSLI